MYQVRQGLVAPLAMDARYAVDNAELAISTTRSLVAPLPPPETAACFQHVWFFLSRIGNPGANIEGRVQRLLWPFGMSPMLFCSASRLEK